MHHIPLKHLLMNAANCCTFFIMEKVWDILYEAFMNLSDLFFPKLNLKDENLTKASWLLRIRWVAVVVETIIVFICAMLRLITIDRYPYFLFLIISLILFNTIATVLLKDRTELKKANLLVQIVFDLTQLFLFLYMLDFVKNPMVEIFYLHLVLSIFVLDLNLNFIIYLILTLMTGYFYHRTGADHHNAHHFFSHFFTMTLLWGILNWMTSILTKFQKTFHVIQESQNRMDRLKSIGAMSSGICHELATPLGTIKLKLNKLNRKKEFNAEDIQMAIAAINQCETSIKKLATSVVTFDKEVESEVDLDLASRELIKHFEDVDFKLKTNTSKKVLVNEVILFQTLMDLIENAVFFSTDKCIEINIEEEFDILKWSIANKGPHFSDLILEKLGEPFLTERKNGNGLGLFNAYNFMLASNGSMELKNLNDGAFVELRFKK